MLKLILFAVVGLVVGIGGGSAVSVMKAKQAYAADVARKAKLVADSLARAEEEGAKAVAHAAGDSTAHDGAGAAGDAAQAAEAAHAAEAAPAAPTAPARGAPHAAASRKPATGDAGAPTATPGAATAARAYGRATQTVEANGGAAVRSAVAKSPAPPARPLPDAAAAPGMAKVAKIFAAMPPKDAAKVLEQLDDIEVQGVISALAEKQAAAILQNFPAPRAALISKGVLRSVLPAKP